MLKDSIKKLARHFGYDVKQHHDPYRDVSDLLAGKKNPVLFDVGANLGQTARAMSVEFPNADIYCFEPSPTTHGKLVENTRDLPRVRPQQLGVGSVPGILEFNENVSSDMSSFLELGEYKWGSVKDRIQVKVDTVDEFCAREGIGFVDLLKSDTQGFDLEVLKGAERMLRERKIMAIYVEVNFQPFYKDIPSMADIMIWMDQFGYKVSAIYDLSYIRRTIGWTDVLFLSPDHRAAMEAL